MEGGAGSEKARLMSMQRDASNSESLSRRSWNPLSCSKTQADLRNTPQQIESPLAYVGEIAELFRDIVVHSRARVERSKKHITIHFHFNY
mmetsp:Transcript_6476/g.14659  ORF Transcript_6476/g.14659 Transcript_6476/m.14659 type:complete len:90 (+) Transcript_6476:338-607(+)